MMYDNPDAIRLYRFCGNRKIPVIMHFDYGHNLGIKHPNLYCDMSTESAIGALKRDVKFFCDFLMEFQDRVLYARDCFTNELQEFIDSLGLPERIQKKSMFRMREI